MRSTTAIQQINQAIKNKGYDLTYCICDNEQFNATVTQYRKGLITIDTATAQILDCIIEPNSHT